MQIFNLAINNFDFYADLNLMCPRFPMTTHGLECPFDGPFEEAEEGWLAASTRFFSFLGGNPCSFNCKTEANQYLLLKNLW